MTTRITIGALGLVAALFGAWTLLSTSRPDQLLSAAIWLGVGVAVHDGVLAPLALVVGWLAVRMAPAWSRGSVLGGAAVLTMLTLVAVPVLGGAGRRPDNPSLLPRDYLLGWAVICLVITVVVVGAALVVRWRTKRVPHGT